MTRPPEFETKIDERKMFEFIHTASPQEIGMAAGALGLILWVCFAGRRHRKCQLCGGPMTGEEPHWALSCQWCMLERRLNNRTRNG